MKKRVILSALFAVWLCAAYAVDLINLALTEPFRLLDGIGTDWKALQMGQPLDFETGGSISIINSVLLVTVYENNIPDTFCRCAGRACV